VHHALLLSLLPFCNLYLVLFGFLIEVISFSIRAPTFVCSYTIELFIHSKLAINFWKVVQFIVILKFSLDIL
jgi:hypothetical protein